MNGALLVIYDLLFLLIETVDLKKSPLHVSKPKHIMTEREII